jgi:2-polyprenyl-6-hydroxyphenyl methylase/3-demethylubiquinone-9 3-methyltransferase
LAESLAKEGAIVVGIDMAEASLEVAKLHLLESNYDIDYKQILVEEFADSNPESFDVVCCLEMLEHVPDPKSVINACSKLVKKGGEVFLSTLNRNPKSYLFAIVGAEYVLNLLPKGTHDFDKFIKPSEMDNFARNSNLYLQNIIGMTYNIFSKKYKLEQDTDVNYLCFL